MSDRYLFRGKRIDNGEWVVGYYAEVSHSNDSSHTHSFILPLERCVDCEVERNERMYEIDPATIGQCTSLHDRHRKLIYEGDILSDSFGLYVIAQVIWNEKNLAWGIRTLGERNYPLCAEYNCEIIGNIHDNPELLDKQ